MSLAVNACNLMKRRVLGMVVNSIWRALCFEVRCRFKLGRVLSLRKKQQLSVKIDLGPEVFAAPLTSFHIY